MSMPAKTLRKQPAAVHHIVRGCARWPTSRGRHVELLQTAERSVELLNDHR